MNKLSSNERRMHTTHEVRAVRKGKRNSVEGYEEKEPYQFEEAQYLNANKSYTFKPNLNLPTHYSPSLRNHENFSYGGKAQQGTRYEQNHHQAYTQPGFQQRQQQQQQQRESRAYYQGQKRTPSFEDQMLNFMSDNKRILNLHEKKISDLENFQANTTTFQANTKAYLKNLEMQIGQLAQAMQKEPKDCMAVTLRSGRELDERRVESKNTEEEKQVKIGEEHEQNCSKATEKENSAKLHPKQQGRKEGVKAYNPPVPFPQRLHKAKLEEHFSKFLNMFKKIEINIPFLEALTQMPHYAKFMKDLLSKK